MYKCSGCTEVQYYVIFTVKIVHCTVYKCTVNSVHCRHVQWTVYIVDMYNEQCTVYKCTENSVRCKNVQ